MEAQNLFLQEKKLVVLSIKRPKTSHLAKKYTSALYRGLKNSLYKETAKVDPSLA